MPKPVKNFILLVDYYRHHTKKRNTAGRYRVGAKTADEASVLLRRAIGFGDITVFAELCSDSQPNPNPDTGLGFEVDFDGEHDAIIRMADNFGSETDRNFQPITEYNIYHVERKVFYDEDSVKRHYYAYRDMKILPNKKNNRFRVYDDMGFKFLRHSVEAALTSIDILRLMERMREHA